MLKRLLWASELFAYADLRYAWSTVISV